MAQKQLLYIDGWLVPKLTKYEVAYNRLWADDSGRDMAGNNKATLIGIYPKLQIEVGSYTKDEMNEFLKRANKAELSVTWYDAEGMKKRENISYYINDFTISLKSNGNYKAFSFNLIPNKKRVF